MRAAERLLSDRVDWLRRLLALQVEVRIDAPSRAAVPVEQRVALEAEGFEPLCTAHIRHPTLVGALETQVEVWTDATKATRAEVVGRGTPRIYLGTLFEDGRCLVSFPDAAVADWLKSPACEVLVDTGNFHEDVAKFRGRVGLQGSVPLLCASVDAYTLHLRLTTLRCSKEPRGSFRCGPQGPVYPLSPIVAAEMISRRDARADAVGLL